MVFYSYIACFVNTEYSHPEYERTHVIYRVNQAEYGIHIRVVAPHEYVNIDSTRRVVCVNSRQQTCARTEESRGSSSPALWPAICNRSSGFSASARASACSVAYVIV